MVASDYKKNRVPDPTVVTSNHAQKVRLHVKEYFEKGVIKYHANEKAKEKRRHENTERSTKTESASVPGSELATNLLAETTLEDDLMVNDSDDRKRKRSTSQDIIMNEDMNGDLLGKKAKTEESETDPPPPPPPPPMESTAMDVTQNGHDDSGVNASQRDIAAS